MESETIIKQILIDKYEIQSVIGKGGMATVYKAIQISLNRPVAIKAIHQNLVHDEEFIHRFLREAQVCASLRHPNIVTVHDIGSIGTIHFMSMEYLEGMTLHEMIQSKGNLGVEDTVNLIKPIAKALAYIHNKNIVHRDVKSSNIFITKEEQPVLMDFGIVYSEGKETLSQYGTVLGTPEYMSPEQAEGKVKADGRSDIYSLGVVLFECLTGRLPFQSNNYLATLHQVLHENPPTIGSINTNVPEWLSSIIAGCLIKDRTLRISDGEILADALQNNKAPDYFGSLISEPAKNEQSTRKISIGEDAKEKSSKDVEKEKQPDKHDRKRSSLLVAIFVTLFVILTVLGILLFDKGYPGSKSTASITKNESSTIQDKLNLHPVTAPTEQIVKEHRNNDGADKEKNKYDNEHPKSKGTPSTSKNESSTIQDKLNLPLATKHPDQPTKTASLTKKESSTIHLNPNISSVPTPSEQIEKERSYNEGADKAENTNEEEYEAEPWVVVEEMPMFPGGETALLQYIAEHTQYPEVAKENNVQGKVIVRFCVTSKGGVDKVSILKGVDPELDNEAIRVVKTLPAFKPGKQGGKPVPVWYMVPINFSLK